MLRSTTLVPSRATAASARRAATPQRQRLGGASSAVVASDRDACRWLYGYREPTALVPRTPLPLLGPSLRQRAQAAAPSFQLLGGLGLQQQQQQLRRQQLQQRRSYIFLPSTPSDLYRLARTALSNIWGMLTGQASAHRTEIAVKLRETGRKWWVRRDGRLVRLRDKFEARKLSSRQKIRSIRDKFRARRLIIRDKFRDRRLVIREDYLRARRLLVGRENLVLLREDLRRRGLVARRRYRMKYQSVKARFETGVRARLSSAVGTVKGGRSRSPPMPLHRYYGEGLVGGWYRRHVVVLDEPASASWFDADGFPRTARDPVTGRFVNPWNSESTDGRHGLFDLWRWRVGRRMKGVADGECWKAEAPPAPAAGGGNDYGDDDDDALEHVRRTIHGEEATPPPRSAPAGVDSGGGPSSSSSGSSSPTVVPTFEADERTWSPPSSESRIKLTWLGHSATLVQMSGFTFLTDPMFSDRASPWDLVGPKRYIPPPVGVDDLPQVLDCVLLSHDHYDHLDYNTVLDLVATGRVKYWAVPLGLKAWLTDRAGVPPERIVELEWWEGVRLVKDVVGAGSAAVVKGGEQFSFGAADDDGADDAEEVRVDGIVREFSGSGGSAGTCVGDGSAPLKAAAVAAADNDDHFDSPRRREMVITCAPAQHWCTRTPFDRNRRLWCSWAVRTRTVGGGFIPDGGSQVDEAQSDGGVDRKDPAAILRSSSSTTATGGGGGEKSPLNFYFAGDTGLPRSFPLHRQIGDRLGPFDLAALPIGAYAPSFFMRDSHADPYEAVEIHAAVRSRRSVGVHWGTFALADERYDEPPRLLRDAVTRKNEEMAAAAATALDAAKGTLPPWQGAPPAPLDFVTVRHGGSVESPDPIERDAESLLLSPPFVSSEVAANGKDEDEDSIEEISYGVAS